MIPFRPRSSCLAVLAALVVLAGCSGEESKDKAATQVAARVNKDEISVHQINFVLSRAGKIPADKAQEASKQILDKLIEQNLLVQKATADKLDRDPDILQMLENSRRQILAQAYMDKVVSAVAAPTEQEIREYYSAHPELFAERRVYRFQQLSIAGGKEVADEVQKALSAGKSLTELEAWAKSKDLRVGNSAVVKAAEQLPLELLPRLHKMKDGQTGILGEANGVAVLQLLASQAQPVDEKAATPTIVQYLVNKRKTDLSAEELKRLKAEAKIEYVGDYAKAEATQPIKAPDALPAAETQSAVSAPAQAADAVSKAIEGL